MSEDELKAIEDEASPKRHKVLALVAEVRRRRAQLVDLKVLAAGVRAFWGRHPGDHVVSQGISAGGRALLERIEAIE